MVDRFVSDEFPEYGLALKWRLARTGVTVIPAGTVLVHSNCEMQDGFMFQTLRDVPLSTIRGLDYVYYEPGSVYIIDKNMFSHKHAPVIKFKNCRLPTKAEYERYEKISTV